MSKKILQISGGVALGLFSVLAGVDLFSVAWGSGKWIGRFSPKWFFTFGGFTVLAVLVLGVVLLEIFSTDFLNSLWKKVIRLRQKLAWRKWIIIAVFLVFPVYLLVYTDWGFVLTGKFLRAWIFFFSILISTVLMVRDQEKLITPLSLVSASLAAGVVFVLGFEFSEVTDYPFSLYWSEGNRIWDYSILFGKYRYNYPLDQKIAVNMDWVRQSLWGLPFLLPSLSLAGIRFWSAFLFTILYAILGWTAIKFNKQEWGKWLGFGLWTMLFLYQGPIYTPLVLAGILVVFLRNSPLWLAFPLLILAGYYAHESRFTWMFAPSFWAVTIAMTLPLLEGRKLVIKDWLRGGLLAIAGLTGSWGVTRVWPRIRDAIQTKQQISIDTVSGAMNIVSPQGVNQVVTEQPLIWSRLLPNDTYSLGIILGLAIAVTPLIILIMYALIIKKVNLNLWQGLAWLLPQLAFLVVGITASVKIGGGTNLHNLDMFLVGLAIMAALAWEAGGKEMIFSRLHSFNWVSTTVLLAVLIPSLIPVLSAKPQQIAPDQKAAQALSELREYVDCASQYGEVLFMDQRQLLTFGYLEDVPLVPDYEKKTVMDEALNANVSYFEPFYADLEFQRFTLIITDRQAILDKESGQSLAEENNTWVEWVTVPLLESYESVENYKLVGMELFMPIGRDFTCP
ncbi:MAG: hypothetical protein JXA19_02260 [Anaerolineales bacterium]|nr:hypothetical protein [Anaerolineales bacterium]